MLSPDRLLQISLERAEKQHGQLVAFWVEVTSDREAMRSKLVELSGVRPIVPIVIRDDGFENPNAVLSDLNRLIQKYRSEFEHLDVEADERIVILLLARTDFKVPQIASPTVLPEWFPVLGSRSVYVVIEDLVKTAEAGINAPELRVPDVCESLYTLEGVLVKRLQQVRQINHNWGNAFFDLVRDDKDGAFSNLLERALEQLGKVSSPSGFRPSARDAQTIVGRLMRIGSSHSPDQLGRPAKALATALALPELPTAAARESLFAVLYRSTYPTKDIPTRICRNLIITVFAGSQLVTASAHADDYSVYPIVLLRSMSYDIRRVLRDQSEWIAGLVAPA
jgi:hypothetical protein